MMKVCLFLAFKTEEASNNGSLGHFCKDIKENHSEMINIVGTYETLLLNCISYEVDVITPLAGT